MVLFGGRSGEHEISLRSAVSVLTYLDQSRYEIIPIKITQQGKWIALSRPTNLEHWTTTLLSNDLEAPSVFIPLESTGKPKHLTFSQIEDAPPVGNVDVVFPVMHGTFSEDGTVQGLLELADIPYVGSGVLASAVGMDKEMSKRLARDAGLKIGPFITLKHGMWNDQEIASKVKELGYPVFVKPCNLGSSVGIHKVESEEQLRAAIKDAFRYDVKVLIEKGIRAREIELSVLENAHYGKPPLVSVAGEVIPHHSFYSYAAKYLDENGASLVIPADLSSDQMKRAQELASRAFLALDCEGMARVDLFLDKDTDEFYFNELNTLPGFTSISMYPKLWEASGIPYTELLSQLIELALARHARKKLLLRSADLSSLKP